MLGGIYERIAGEPGGERRLAAARLRRRTLVVLHKALDASGLGQSELAKKLGVRRSAVNQVFRGDGNVRINTLADYLFEMGYELKVELVPAGEPRRAALREALIGAVAKANASASWVPPDAYTQVIQMDIAHSDYRLTPTFFGRNMDSSMPESKSSGAVYYELATAG